MTTTSVRWNCLKIGGTLLFYQRIYDVWYNYKEFSFHSFFVIKQKSVLNVPILKLMCAGVGQDSIQIIGNV